MVKPNWQDVGSIQGPRGPKGPAGDDGQDGRNGSDGKDGIKEATTDYILFNNNFILIWKYTSLEKSSTSTFQGNIKLSDLFPSGFSQFTNKPTAWGNVTGTQNVSPSSSYLTGLQVYGTYSESVNAQVRKDVNEYDIQDGDTLDIVIVAVGEIK